MNASSPPPTKFLVERKKITAYLLNLEHPDGGSKAKFFLARGFSALNSEGFAQRLLDHPLLSRSKLTSITPDIYAPKFVYEGPLFCPDDSTPVVRSVWELRTGEVYGRLVTAYPSRWRTGSPGR